MTIGLDTSLPLLVVDDFATMSRIVCALLRQCGFTDIELVHDGLGALDKMRARKFALVISDCEMEPMSGLELLRHIRSDPLLSSVHFILISATSDKDYALRAKNAGADGFLVKPFNLQTLKQKIRDVFSDRA